MWRHLRITVYYPWGNFSRQSRATSLTTMGQLSPDTWDEFSQDPGTILAEDTTKMPCKRFHNTGSCDYGEGCRFSHMTEEKRQELLKMIQEENEVAERKTQEDTEQKQSTLKDWLAKKCKTVSSVKEEEVPQFSLPETLRNIPNIPPSLLPPKFEDFQNTEPVEWG